MNGVTNITIQTAPSIIESIILKSLIGTVGGALIGLALGTITSVLIKRNVILPSVLTGGFIGIGIAIITSL